MKTAVIVLTIAAAVWSLFVWGLVALLLLAGAVLPDAGSIISFKSPWWVVSVVWIVGPVILGLHWAAVKSFRGMLALLCVALTLVAASLFSPPARDLVLIYLWPLLLLLPLLWYWHRRVKRGGDGGP